MTSGKSVALSPLFWSGGDFGPGEILISAQSEILVLVRMADNYSSMILSCILTLHTRHRQPRVGIQGRLSTALAHHCHHSPYKIGEDVHCKMRYDMSQINSHADFAALYNVDCLCVWSDILV